MVGICGVGVADAQHKCGSHVTTEREDSWDNLWPLYSCAHVCMYLYMHVHVFVYLQISRINLLCTVPLLHI